jgi:hypothetical protein
VDVFVSGMGPVVCSCEQGNGPSGSIKGEGVLTSLLITGFSKGLCSMELVT